MTIHDVEQNTDAWFRLRAGKVTASEVDALISPEFEIRTGKGVKTYLYQKLGEAYRPGGKPTGGFTSWATEQGQELEDEARKLFAFESDDRLIDAGFCEHDDHRCGCSPDTLLGEDGGAEIKCPERTNHVRYLIEGVLPKDYAAQLHFSMYVTGRKWWKFVSHHRGFPMFVLTVQRDEEICATIAKALAGFYEKFDAAMAKLRSA